MAGHPRPAADFSILSAALRRQAADDPESPCVFWPEGWNWRWWSWRQLADQAERWSAALAGAAGADGLPPAAAVAFAGDSYPQAIALDLAVQLAGWTPVPVGSSERPAAPAVGTASPPSCCLAWAEVVDGQVRVVRLGEPGTEAPATAWAPAGLRAAVEHVEGAVAASAGRRRDSRDREVLVAGWPLGLWEARLLGAWALMTGAVLVLEADPARRLGTVLWARPTLFHGSAAEVAALRGRLDGPRRGAHRWRVGRGGPVRRPGRRWGRLRTLFQSEEPAAAEVAFWEEHGARLLRLPASGAPALDPPRPPPGLAAPAASTAPAAPEDGRVV